MGIAIDSIVSMGCIISGGRVMNSILSPDVRINSYTEMDSSILFSHVNVGRHSRIRRAIIDRHVHIPERTEIGFDLEEDRKKYHVSDSGIVVVVPEQRMFEDRRTTTAPLRAGPASPFLPGMHDKRSCYAWLIENLGGEHEDKSIVRGVETSLPHDHLLAFGHIDLGTDLSQNSWTWCLSCSLLGFAPLLHQEMHAIKPGAPEFSVRP